jgi:hypothetical protein
MGYHGRSEPGFNDVGPTRKRPGGSQTLLWGFALPDVARGEYLPKRQGNVGRVPGFARRRIWPEDEQPMDPLFDGDVLPSLVVFNIKIKGYLIDDELA